MTFLAVLAVGDAYGLQVAGVQRHVNPPNQPKSSPMMYGALNPSWLGKMILIRLVR